MNFIRMLFILVIFIVINVYLFIRGWQALPGKTAVHIIYTAFYLLAAFGVFIGVLLGSRLPDWLSYICELTGGYWIILFIFFLSAALLGDMLRIADHFFHIFPDWITTNYEHAKHGYLITVFILLGMMSVIGYIRFSNPGITKLELTLENSKGESETEEIILVAASDIHLGNLIRKDRLDDWVDLINSQQPDIILLAGDIFDHNMHAVESQQMDKVLTRLNARYGVYAIPGNHDFYAGIDRAVEYMKKSCMHVLRDQAVTIDNRFVIIGRDDLTNRQRKPLDSLVAGLNSGLPRIVLDHQPVSLMESCENNIDLHLSGHTHNGQTFPYNYFISWMYDLSYGYRKMGETHFYVTSGLGLWGAPLRIGTRSEIVRIRLSIN
ncbi:MAG: metallophosphoesterase [Bacteroidales bacterium]|nr:metallophosphoesterase [Bacteroidales bacterium]